MTYQVVPFSAEHIPQALNIERKSQPAPWSQNIFQSCLNKRYFNFALLNSEQNLIGFLISDHIAGEISLMNICIAPEYRRKGLAQILFQQLVDTATEIHAEMIWLEVRESNKPAQNLYFQLGFNEIAIRQNYYPAKGGMEDAIVMSLSLD